MPDLPLSTRLALRARKYTSFPLRENHDAAKSILLAGSGRSGTTWAGDLLNADGKLRVMFEPFHPTQVRRFAKMPQRFYLREDDTESPWGNAIAQILRGEIRQPWVDQYNTRRIVDKRLIKAIRCNFFLKWISRQMPEVKLVFMLRFPTATVLSQKSGGWGARFDFLYPQPDLIDDFLKPFLGSEKAVEDDLARRVCFWCLENLVPLRQFAPGQIHILFYENLCLHPEAELRALFAASGLPFHPGALDLLDRPSLMTRADTALPAGEEKIVRWKNRVPEEQAAQCREVMARFGFDRVWDENGIPLVSGDACLGLFS